MSHPAAEPPYRRIAAEIRRRIDLGELRPGDPVPSARRITTVAATRGALGCLPEAANSSAIRRKYARSSAGAPANGSVMPVTLLAPVFRPAGGFAMMIE